VSGASYLVFGKGFLSKRSRGEWSKLFSRRSSERIFPEKKTKTQKNKRHRKEKKSHKLQVKFIIMYPDKNQDVMERQNTGSWARGEGSIFVC
jgi:hypothetical protein